MKPLLTLLSSMMLASIAFGQTAISINAADMPVPSGAFNILHLTSVPSNPAKGNNQNWYYGTLGGTPETTTNYIAETDPFFTSAGIDVYRDASKNLTPNLYYNISYELDFNANKVEQKGLYVYPQGYALTNFTGNSADSITFPTQGYLMPTARTFISFPFTANSAWHSTTQHSVDFNLSIAAYGFNKTPGKQRYSFVQHDSIVGWGKMTVYTPNGNSIPYDVLMMQSESYTVDSFYLGGSPAPAALLSGFGISQGQKMGATYAYNFYRKGSYGYLMRQFYGSDNTFSTMADAYISTDNITTTGIDDAKPLYSSLLYPNPTNGSQLNVQIMGKEWELTHFTIMDMMGRVVQEGTPDISGNGIARITLSETLANQPYIIQIKDPKNQEVVREKFELMR